MKQFAISLFIFRRDLRLNDNTALRKALENSNQVIACFIFDSAQVTEKNKYRSMNAMQFMVESLKDLGEQLKAKGGKLYLFSGTTSDIVESLITEHKIEAVYVNQDYTPFSVKRDEQIKKICIHHHIEFISCHDALLTEPYTVLTGGGVPYSMFTPFFRNASHIPVDPVQPLARTAVFYTKAIKGAQTTAIYKEIVPHDNPHIWVHGGRENAKKIIRNLHHFVHYKKERDIPALSTTDLSAHNKFGTISIRELYHAIADQLGKDHLLIQQLYWRDFFTHIAYHSPFVFGAPFKEKYANIRWNEDKEMFKRWCTGTTGFPIVDAGMRQLNATGYMHNRVRMIVGSFLVKDLLINWQWGERYFAQQLIDYDPAVNNGNWQWVASTGCDSQPYFRIFNPWLQQKKFDPDCKYIKEWVPELKDIPSQALHHWYAKHQNFKTEYPAPMVDHGTQSTLVKNIYKNA